MLTYVMLDPSVSEYIVMFRGQVGLEADAVAVTQAAVPSGPVVRVNALLDGGTATDAQGDLASYLWAMACGIYFLDGTYLPFWPTDPAVYRVMRRTCRLRRLMRTNGLTFLRFRGSVACSLLWEIGTGTPAGGRVPLLKTS